MHRLSLDATPDIAFSQPAHYRRHVSAAGTPRVVAGVPGSDPSLLLALAGGLEAPLFVLYVLHTARGEGPTGRYQSVELDHDALRAFVEDHRAFLSGDGRFDLWVYSPSQRATLVWDRHDLLHGYGPVDGYVEALEARGFTPGAPGMTQPHVHHYRPGLDEQARAVLARFDWAWSPLRPEDEQ